MYAFSKIIKKIETKGFILLTLFSYQPISDFIKTNINDQVFDLSRALSYLFIILLFSFLVVYLLRIIFKNKDLLIITSLVGFFCFFTFNYYLFNKFPEIVLYKFINSSSVGEIFFVFSFFVFVVISFFLSLFIKHLILRIFLYSILGTVILFDMLVIIPKYYYVLNHNPILNFTMPPKVTGTVNNTDNNYNVYFLLPDAMPSPERLNNIFFDSYEYNEINELKKLNFNILKNVEANAVDSYSSIPHFFSMDYLFKKNGKISPKLHVEIKNIFNGYNPVIAEFRKRKYKFVQVDGERGHIAGCVGIEDICIRNRGNLFINQDLIFLDRSYIKKILDKLSTQNKILPILKFLKINTKDEIIFGKNSRSPSLTDKVIVEDKFNEILPNISDSPYFFYWWMPFPHIPIRFNKNCEMPDVSKGEFIGNSYEVNYEIWSDQYLGQVKCAETQLVKWAKKIVDHDKNAIILIHSDHGMDHAATRSDHVKRRDLDDISYKNLLGMFAAYRMPKQCNKFLNSEYSPVNAFKIIFACLDNTKPDLLPHKSFLLNYVHSNVEGILKKNEFGKYILKKFNDE